MTSRLVVVRAVLAAWITTPDGKLDEEEMGKLRPTRLQKLWKKPTE